MPNKTGSFEIMLCPDKMSDGSPGTVQLVRNVGIYTLAAAKRQLREMAKHPNFPTGVFWVQDCRGVPLYGINVTEEPKTERIRIPGKCEEGHDETEPGWCGRCDRPTQDGYKTRPVAGQVRRRLKPGNMPWNR